MDIQYRNSVYDLFQRLPPGAALSLDSIATAVPRPTSLRLSSSKLLNRDPRFKLVQVLEQNQVKAGVRLSAPKAQQSVNPVPKNIKDVVARFLIFLSTLTEQQLIAKENERDFKVAFHSWKSREAIRGAYPSVKNELKKQNLICEHRSRIIFVPPSHPQRKNDRIAAIDAALGDYMTKDRMLRDKGGLTIAEFCFDKDAAGEQVVLKKGDKRRIVGSITNTHPMNPIEFTGFGTTQKDDKNRFTLFHFGPSQTFSTPNFPFTIRGGERIHIAVEFSANVEVGTVNNMLKFEFFGGAVFYIGRMVTVHIGDPQIKQLLQPTAPFVKRHRLRHARDPAAATESRTRAVVVDGERPPGSDNSQDNFIRPEFFDVPEAWKNECRLGEDTEQLTEMRTQHGAANLVDLSHKLLWTEELQMDKDIQVFDMERTQLEVRGALLALTVPGLAEKRPSVLKGDHVLVYRSRPGANDNSAAGGSGAAAAPAGSGRRRGNKVVKYKGYVHRVERNQVLLKFSKQFHREYIGGQAVSVEFTYSRMVLRICHQAVDALTPALLQYLTTPASNTDTESTAAAGSVGAPATLLDIHPVNRDLNDEQKLAVRSIVQHSNRDLHCPYVIFGPPGTGKTSTMVEAILQYGKHHPGARILICAPSNAAADVLLSRLAVSLPKSELFRYNSYQRDLQTADAIVREYSKYDAEVEAFQFPGMVAFLRYRYVVCTCIMAGKLHNYGVPRGHFSAAFVDEAGHGWEPEVIAAFSALLHLEIPARRGATLTAGATAAGINNAQLVLAGDPQQLGPIVRSDAVNDDHGGLSISLLERLILSHPAYQRDPAAYPGRLVGYDPRCLTMLRKCYRCHPDILRIPNELFYNNALEAAADPVVTHNLVTWTGLPQQGFPMLFHGVEGENMREANSPSWFNIAEIEVVFKYVRDLVDIARVPAREIAVITPYHKQVTKVLQLLRNKNAYGERYAEVTVGSCEKMQGQERRVVIISTVRSSPEFLEHDKYFNLGFVASPKRFNVAVTRAKALVVVVGNPHVLVADPNWGALLRFCLERGGYTGCSPPEIPAADAGGPDDPTGDANGNISEGEQGESIGASWDHVDSLSAQLSGLGVHPAVAPAPATPSARSGSLLGDGAEDSWVEVDAAEADWSGLEH